MKTVEEVNRQLSDVEAIDVYLAQTLCQQHEVKKEMLTDDVAFYLIVALSWHLRHGHTCLDLEHIAGSTWFANEESDKAGYTFPSLTVLADTATALATGSAEVEPLIYEPYKLYLSRYQVFEKEVAAGVARRLKTIAFDDKQYDVLRSVWPHLFDCSTHEEQDWQQIATACAITRQFAVINGGPGTGKTYTVARLLIALQAAASAPLNIRLAAPTGKAAQRLTESVSNSLAAITAPCVDAYKTRITTQAQTLHRLLGMRPVQLQPKYHQDNPIHCDVLIIDEASMVDLALMARVIRALPSHAHLYLVGDVNQLPAVESGNVLEALAGSSEEHLTEITGALHTHLLRLCPHLPPIQVNERSINTVFSLKISRRFSGKLAEVAEAIRQGDVSAIDKSVVPWEVSSGNLFENNAVWLTSTTSSTALRELAKQSFSPLLKASTPGEALMAIAECRWLTPTRQGAHGVEALNNLVETSLSNQRVFRQSHYHGRPIMVMENDYTQRLFNGDTGVIWQDDDGVLRAYFQTAETTLRKVSLSRLPRVETVYAMTIHKSQGSEFKQVVIWMPEASGKAKRLFTRELLYTGLTRAKNGCLLVGDKVRIADILAIKSTRFSGLAQRVEALWYSNHTDEK